jgi:hypothetical protein
MKKHLTKKRVILLAALAAAAIAAVAGYAYWTNGGSGSGTATAGTADNNIVLSATGWAGIKPGQTKNVDITVDNTANSYSSYVKDVKLDPAHAGVEADGTQDGIDTGNASCLSSDFSYNQTAPNIDATVAASGSQTFNGAASLTFANTALNQDACQGASVKLYLVVDNT